MDRQEQAHLAADADGASDTELPRQKTCRVDHTHQKLQNLTTEIIQGRCQLQALQLREYRPSHEKAEQMAPVYAWTSFLPWFHQQNHHLFNSQWNHLSTSMAWAALAFAKAESFVFTFFLPTLKLLPFFLSLPSIWKIQKGKLVSSQCSKVGLFRSKFKKRCIAKWQRVQFEELLRWKQSKCLVCMYMLEPSNLKSNATTIRTAQVIQKARLLIHQENYRKDVKFPQGWIPKEKGKCGASKRIMPFKEETCLGENVAIKKSVP